uniref:Uncharacterized protein n=1 Tax=Anopheles atroparvus TaxID=41427 RepID=A0A182JLK2_ANOAO
MLQRGSSFVLIEYHKFENTTFFIKLLVTLKFANLLLQGFYLLLENVPTLEYGFQFNLRLFQFIQNRFPLFVVNANAAYFEKHLQQLSWPSSRKFVYFTLFHDVVRIRVR